ncbi:hypothetical protein [Kineosporia sp. A_224]|uniref:hypothetical protein n=1 Tax=Kineosporia sp. A_224 TaxID=1962180 RepID=UPI000B4BEF0A|nr:hypothetical protein [Kineosporia sp. A_224]
MQAVAAHEQEPAGGPLHDEDVGLPSRSTSPVEVGGASRSRTYSSPSIGSSSHGSQTFFHRPSGLRLVEDDDWTSAVRPSALIERDVPP